MAFHTLAKADKGAFDAIVDREAQARLERAKRLLGANQGLVTIEGCKRASREDCVVAYTVANVEHRLVSAAPNVRALLGGVVRYSEAMAELCEADDLDAAKSKSEAAAGSVKALAALVPGLPAITNAIIDVSVWAGNERLRTKRRRALLTIALQAEAPIAEASRVIGEQAAALGEVILDAEVESLTVYHGALNAGQQKEKNLLNGRPLEEMTPAVRDHIMTLREERSQDLARMVKTSQNISLARKLKSDWNLLDSAHKELIKKLRNPGASLEDALADINALLALLDAIKGSSGSESADG